ncbi:DUF2283 domain-containing protein [Nocardia sp. NPDC058518]|uniref:DUF2283 domain-containing protein n=1 Tax=Nocardia sp. NPDC058518 TaxID=3346534 RepID=UPI00366645A9
MELTNSATNPAGDVLVRMTYDAEANAAMIYLKGRIEPGEAVRQHTITLETADIVLDFSTDDLLLGIEIIGARAIIPAEALAAAEQLG